MQFETSQKVAAENAFHEADKKENSMRLSSVRLNNGAGFTGSGVLVFDREKEIGGIVTAKHNLWKSKGSKTPPDTWTDKEVEQMVDDFYKGLVIHYAPKSISEGGQPTASHDLNPHNSKIDFRGVRGKENWEHDLMFISFRGGMPLTAKAVSQINLPTDKEFYKELINKVMVKKLTVFVTGFGDPLDAHGKNTGTSQSNPLQVRTAKVTAFLSHVQASAKARYDDVLITEASPDSSTAGGDSGGPMFYSDGKDVYLLGATLGSNYAKDQVLSDDKIENNGATSLYRKSHTLF